MKVLAENRRARFDYDVTDTVEAGIELKGFEVKSIRDGRANLTGSFAIPRGSELWLVNMDVPPFQANNTPEDYESDRSRRLLLRHEEVGALVGKQKSERLTIVPLKVYDKAGLIKIELGIARSRKKADKREVIRKRETDREIRRAVKR